ncbi:MAG: hypothetical protein R2712_25575 [Vicinamibacterales bacterium]
MREQLGAALLAAGRPAEAERVFRADLEHNVGNPRSLYGLWQSLAAQRAPGAAAAETDFTAAWSTADVPQPAPILRHPAQ